LIAEKIEIENYAARDALLSAPQFSRIFMINYVTIALYAKTKQNFFIISALILSSRIKMKFSKTHFNRVNMPE